jgi:hypothetical protein
LGKDFILFKRGVVEREVPKDITVVLVLGILRLVVE